MVPADDDKLLQGLGLRVHARELFVETLPYPSAALVGLGVHVRARCPQENSQYDHARKAKAGLRAAAASRPLAAEKHLLQIRMYIQALCKSGKGVARPKGCCMMRNQHGDNSSPPRPSTLSTVASSGRKRPELHDVYNGRSDILAAVAADECTLGL